MSVLKTAWANLQDGLGNRFSWSHVKAIFYNYAEQKLLSTKLDEMDALIDEKIAKAMMSNVQVNDQNRVPTSSLAFSMNQAITELNSDMQNKARGYLDIQGSNKFVGFAVGEYNPSILINPVEKFLRLQFTDNDNQSKIYDYQLIGNADFTQYVFEKTNVSIPASGDATLDFDISRSGYRAIGVVGFASSSSYAVFSRVQTTFSKNKVSVTLRNTSSNQVDTIARIQVLYVPS